MATITLDLPNEVYERLRAAAARQGEPVETVAQAWLTAQSAQAHSNLPPPAPPGERERATEVLRAAGLLAESSPEMKARAARSTLTLEEARAILDRAGGKPLSEVILEMRGPKE